MFCKAWRVGEAYGGRVFVEEHLDGVLRVACVFDVVMRVLRLSCDSSLCSLCRGAVTVLGAVCCCAVRPSNGSTAAAAAATPQQSHEATSPTVSTRHS